MRIVVLDGFTLNPGDLCWDALAQLGDLVVYDRTAAFEIVERSLGAVVLLTNKTPLSADTLSQLPDLKYVGVLATGYNVVDVSAARERGVVVTNVPAYSTPAVAQHVFALLLELINRVGAHSASVAQGTWQRSADFSYCLSPIEELDGKTFGIIGMGAIGQRVAAIATALGMRVVTLDRSNSPIGEKLSLCQLLAESDVVSLHCPLTADTESIVNSEFLSQMKPSAVLINTGRGGLVDEHALAEALNAGVIAGAGLDVLVQEPPRDGSPLIGARNCVITPHVAWAALAARQRLMEIAVGNVRGFLSGTPQNVVS